MVLYFSNADLFMLIWNGLIGGLIAAAMFHWGRKYERKQIEKEKESPWREPKEPTL